MLNHPQPVDHVNHHNQKEHDGNGGTNEIHATVIGRNPSPSDARKRRLAVVAALLSPFPVLLNQKDTELLQTGLDIRFG